MAWAIIADLNIKNGIRRRELRARGQTNAPAYVSTVKTKAIIASVATFLCILQVFYLSGGPQWIRSLIEEHFTQISTAVANFLAQFLGWIFSGIVGNATYAVFKKKLSRIRVRV